jgi:sugar transferase (PEP-CTERM/EpsH1 system associated)
MPIRVMHVVDTLGKGGLENGLVNLIQRMNADDFEHTVYVIRQLGPNADRLSKDRVRVVCLGKKETDSRFQVPALARSIRDIRPDIVHSRNWSTVEAVLAGRWVRSCAIIHSEHGLEASSEAKQPWRRVCFRRVAFEMADRVLCVSNELRDLHARMTGFAAKRISVIHNGVDSSRFFPDATDRARIRQELDIADHEFCIGAVGNLFLVKDHMTLLRAARGLAEVSKDWRMVIAGEGPQRSDLEAFINAHPEWKRRVRFIGSSDRVPELLRAFDVYILPSINEGISNSLLEAMATGLPAVATEVGGNPEVIVNRVSGLLFPAGAWLELTERLLMLQARKDLRVELGRHAIARVRSEFSIDSMVRKYEQLYRSVAPAVTAGIPVTAGI